MKAPKKLLSAKNDGNIVTTYEQAIYWERLRAHYFRQHNRSRLAEVAEYYADTYCQYYNALPERLHVFR